VLDRVEISSSMNSRSFAKSISLRTFRMLIAGYSLGAVGLVGLIMTNGVAGIPVVVNVSVDVLVAIGLLLIATEMLLLRTSLIQSWTGNGFAMQGIGLFGLFIGAALVIIAPSSLTACVMSIIIIVISGVITLAGVDFLGPYFFIASTRYLIYFLFIGTVLIFLGAGLIAASNIAYEFVISQMENTIFVDIGATISAYGCILAAYSYFMTF